MKFTLCPVLDGSYKNINRYELYELPPGKYQKCPCQNKPHIIPIVQDENDPIFVKIDMDRLDKFK